MFNTTMGTQAALVYPEEPCVPRLEFNDQIWFFDKDGEPVMRIHKAEVSKAEWLYFKKLAKICAPLFRPQPVVEGQDNGTHSLSFCQLCTETPFPNRP